ncbi:MAG: DNA recombination protein RmuC [Candidatus Zixiibacteriota bacterium]
MEIPSSVLFVLWLAVLLVLVWIAVRLRPGQGDRTAERLESTVAMLKADLISRQADSLLAMRDSIDSANRIINERLAEGTISLDRRMAVLGELESQLGKLAVQASNIENVGKNIQSLSDLLRPPKLRGAVGELLLENILSQILPPAGYETQHCFPDGYRVDAVVKLSGRLLPIDAKFPLEAFERVLKEPEDQNLQKQFAQSLRKHIDDIALKYIRPADQTLDFAIMYIPAEAVYFQLISQNHQDGLEYALSRRVIPSSPGHLYAFLATVAALHSHIAVSALEMGEGSRRLQTGLDQLFEASEQLARYHSRMEGSLRALTAAFERAKSELDQIRLQLEKLRQPFERAESPLSDIAAQRDSEAR